ncbi:MAG TPA: dihydrolipoamide acetyltransferase family protein, partial [Lacibacter sp.]|nr:dihydrolipoamide acetyltransferase family protein [Lacibacter sp.]
IAAQEGIGMAELETIPGTGNEGRVTKRDILQYVSTRKPGIPATTQAVPPRKEEVLVIPMQQVEQPTTSPAPATVYSGNVEIIEMDRMRKLIADHMVRSKQTSAHVTSFTEADVTNLVQWRERVKKDFEKREGTKITFTPLFIEAVVRCIKKYPLMNSSVDGNKIVVKKDINIGMATALPSGNLIVPVIRSADQLNLVGLTRQVNGLAENARNNKLKADDTQGGTFTLTNVGTFGSLMGTPIINQPQVAILAVGAIKKRPVVLETPHGDSIAIRHMMYLSLSYDHRIIDGSLGATFLTAVANELENFNSERGW